MWRTSGYQQFPWHLFFFFLTSHLCDICISLFLIRITGSSFCNLSVSVSFSFPSCNEILPVGMCSPEYWHPALWGSGMAIIVAIKFCFRLIERLFKMYFLYHCNTCCIVRGISLHVPTCSPNSLPWGPVHHVCFYPLFRCRAEWR